MALFMYCKKCGTYRGLTNDNETQTRLPCKCGSQEVLMPKCTDCGNPATITWDGVWLCKPCEKKRLEAK